VVVVKAECRFRRPARYDDLLRLRTTVSRISAAKIEHQYELFRDDECLAIGHVTLAILDRQGRVQPVPEWMAEEGGGRNAEGGGRKAEGGDEDV
jgi:acyl-CoA thioester hydrolase